MFFFRKRIETMDKRNPNIKICYCLGFCKGTFRNYVGKKRWVCGQYVVHAWLSEQRVGSK